MRSEWLAASAPAGAVAGNGGHPVSWGAVARSCLSRSRADWWAFKAMYEPLELMARFPMRVEKYYWATVSSVEMVEAAFGKGVPCTRHLHRHTVLTCYLDALVDTHRGLGWPVQFGMAVFGMRPDLPAFLDEHDEGFRIAVARDYPRLRLAASGEHSGLMAASLLEAAAVEAAKAAVPHLEHKLLSNLVCIRPFLERSGLVPREMLEPLAMIYTFFDDALDVLEDGPGTHMATEEGVELASGLARASAGELNARASGGDWKDLAETAIEFARRAALAQIRSPEEYRQLESGAPPVCVRAAVAFFALYRISRGDAHRSDIVLCRDGTPHHG